MQRSLHLCGTAGTKQPPGPERLVERAGKDALFTPAGLAFGSGRRGPSTNHVSRQRPDMRIGGVVYWPQVSCRRPCRGRAWGDGGQSGTISDDHTFWPSAYGYTTVAVNGAVADVTAPFCMYQ